MSNKACSDVRIFNGSIVDHLWIYLLDLVAGYVDKSFRENSLHNRFIRGLQGVTAHRDYRNIALPRQFAGFGPVTRLRRAFFIFFVIYSAARTCFLILQYLLYVFCLCTMQAIHYLQLMHKEILLREGENNET